MSSSSSAISAAASKSNNYPFSPLHVSLLLKSCTCTMSVQTKTRLFSANICPQCRNKLTLILSDFHKNASVFCCIMRKSFAALLFYHSVQTRIIHFELWNIFYIMKNMLSSCATEKESPQFSPVELSSPGNLHFPILCPVHAMVPLSSLHSYTGTGSQSPLCQMLT